MNSVYVPGVSMCNCVAAEFPCAPPTAPEQNHGSTRHRSTTALQYPLSSQAASYFFLFFSFAASLQSRLVVSKIMPTRIVRTFVPIIHCQMRLAEVGRGTELGGDIVWSNAAADTSLWSNEPVSNDPSRWYATQHQQQRHPVAATMSFAANGLTRSATDTIRELKKLFDDGVITEAE
jgi:hypothetical protein